MPPCRDHSVGSIPKWFTNAGPLVLGFSLHLGAQGLWWGLTGGLVFVSALLAARFAVITRHAIASVT